MTKEQVFNCVFFFLMWLFLMESYLPDPPPWVFSLSALPRYAPHLRERSKMVEPQITSMLTSTNLFLLLLIRSLQTFLRLDSKYKEAEMHTLVLTLFQQPNEDELHILSVASEMSLQHSR